MKILLTVLLSCLLVSCSDKIGMGFEKGSEVSITLFDPLIFPNGKGLEQFEHLYFHKETSEMVIVKTEKGEQIQIPIEKIRSIDDGLGGGIEFSRNFEEPVTEVKAEFEGVNYDVIEDREDVYYVKGLDTPYTGKTYALHQNGQMKIEGKVKDGKRDGLWTSWYENGQKLHEVNWKDGEQYGLSATWHANGEKNSEVNIKDGLYDGLLTGWHDNGEKSHESNWKDGKIVSQKDWDEEGEPVVKAKESKK